MYNNGQLRRKGHSVCPGSFIASLSIHPPFNICMCNSHFIHIPTLSLYVYPVLYSFGNQEDTHYTP